jgi:hypothetical protein
MPNSIKDKNLLPDKKYSHSPLVYLWLAADLVPDRTKPFAENLF